MARIPIEIIRIGKQYHSEIDSAIGIANGNQDEFIFSYLKPVQERKFPVLRSVLASKNYSFAFSKHNVINIKNQH